MRVILAMTWSTWKSASSYRMSMLLTLVGLLLSVAPLYLVANALQDTMAGRIRGEGAQYFAFVLAGMIATTIISQALSSMPSTVGTAATSGTLDSLFLTPTPTWLLVIGLATYGFLWTAIRTLVMLGGGVAFGATIVWTALPQAALVLALLTLAYLPLGLFLTASQIAFRTTGPLMPGILLASTFLGGVYYPVHVIPAELRVFAGAVPLTYGLRAFRQVLLEGLPLSAVWGDLLVLVGFAVLLGIGGILALKLAMRHARKTGSLSTY